MQSQGVMASLMKIGESVTKRARLEVMILVVNLVFLAFVVLYLVSSGIAPTPVKPLVQADTRTTARIHELELTLQRDPNNVKSALELARIYQDAGEFPWSYDALRAAEASGDPDPAWRLRLGLAYIELGKNDDGLRVLRDAERRCASRKSCPADVRVKLELFGRVAALLQERRIDTRRQRAAAEKALHEVLKPVQVDPAKMRPKGPATPPAPPAPPAPPNTKGE
jgi:hypothetical protein